VATEVLRVLEATRLPFHENPWVYPPIIPRSDHAVACVCFVVRKGIVPYTPAAALMAAALTQCQRLRYCDHPQC